MTIDSVLGRADVIEPQGRRPTMDDARASEGVGEQQPPPVSHPFGLSDDDAIWID